MQDFQASLIASFISVLIFSPTDVIRTKLNLKSQPITKMFNHIYKAEGIKGFYRGLAVSATATPLCTGLYFSLYEKMKISMHSIESTKISSNLAASIITGFICNTITNPLWVLKNRI